MASVKSSKPLRLCAVLLGGCQSARGFTGRGCWVATAALDPLAVIISIFATVVATVVVTVAQAALHGPLRQLLVLPPSGILVDVRLGHRLRTSGHVARGFGNREPDDGTEDTRSSLERQLILATELEL